MSIWSWLKKVFLRIFGYEEVWEYQVVRLKIVDENGNPYPKTALEYLKHIKEYGHIPLSIEKPCNGKRPCTLPSNSEMKRWLNSGSVIISGKKPKPNDLVTFPITELVFFPNGRHKTTMV